MRQHRKVRACHKDLREIAGKRISEAPIRNLEGLGHLQYYVRHFCFAETRHIMTSLF